MPRTKVSKNSFITAVISVFLIFSCTKTSFDTEEELWEHLKNPDNGYYQEKSINGVTYSLLYKPTDLFVKQELRGEVSKEKIDSLRKKYDEYIYFSLSMSRANQELLNSVAGNRQEFGAMVNQLAFGMEHKIHLFTERKDTIPMVDYVYPRMYGMSKNTSMLLVYPRENIGNSKELSLTIEDIGFGTGEVRLSQEISLIKKQPKLKL